MKLWCFNNSISFCTIRMKKKLCVVSSHVWVWWWAEKSAVTLGEALIERWYNVKYLTMYGSQDKYPITGEEFCLNENEDSGSIALSLRLFRRSMAISRFCAEDDIDTIISHRESCNIASILSKLFWNRAKIILSIRGSIDRKWPSYRTLARFLYPSADRIVTIVSDQARNLVENYWIDQSLVTYVHNMIDFDDITTRSEEDLWEYNDLFSKGKYTFIHVGRLDIAKNQKMLIEAFDRFHSTFWNSQLVIVWDGLLWRDGNLKEELFSQRERLSSKDDIHFLWYQSNPYRFMRRSNAFVLTSQWEGMPRVLLEALACELPIISTDCQTGPRDILMRRPTEIANLKWVFPWDFGLLVPVDNTNQLVNAMETLYSDPKLQADFIHRSHERAREFSIRKITTQWERILG